MAKQNLGIDEMAKLEAIEALVLSLREDAGEIPATFGVRASDMVARIVGSWKFILSMGAFIVSYIGYNVYLGGEAFDTYPFILLNLFLSLQAALFLPVILMAQNRTEAKDRKSANRAYRTIGHIEQLVRLLAEMEGVSQSDSDENGSS
jgi:uncharacterized membrane protein